MSTRERVMTQEQLMKVKIKYLEDRLNTMEKSLGRIIDIVIHNSGDALKDLNKESKDPFIKVMEQGESDYELI